MKNLNAAMTPNRILDLQIAGKAEGDDFEDLLEIAHRHYTDAEDVAKSVRADILTELCDDFLGDLGEAIDILEVRTKPGRVVTDDGIVIERVSDESLLIVLATVKALAKELAG